MSQCNDCISGMLSSPEIGAGLKRILLELAIKRAVRGINVLNSSWIKSKVRELLVREPGLFSGMRNSGKSTEQIVEHYHDKISRGPV